MATAGDRESSKTPRTITTAPVEVYAPRKPPQARRDGDRGGRLPGSGGPGGHSGGGGGDGDSGGGGGGGGGGEGGLPPHLIIPPEEWSRIAEELELAPRELEVVQFLFDGKCESQIAWELGILISTVHTYIKRMYARTGATNHCELLVCIFQEHLNPTESHDGEEE